MFGVSGGNTAPAFEMQECVLDQMPEFVQLLVVRSLCGSVFSGRNHRVDTPACGLLDERIAVVAFIRNQMLCRDPFHQAASLCAICHDTLRHNDSERHTMRIHGQMYLGVEPPLSGSSLDCRPWRRLRAGALYNDWRRSSAIHSPAHPSGFRAVSPISLCPASDKTAGARSSSPPSPAANPATGRRCVKSRTRH